MNTVEHVQSNSMDIADLTPSTLGITPALPADLLDRELAQLQELSARIQASGAIAPAGVSIGYTTKQQHTYYQVNGPKAWRQHLGRSGAKLNDWRHRIQRRNALQVIERYALALKDLKDLRDQIIHLCGHIPVDADL